MNELDKVVLPEAAANPEKASDDANLDNVSAACDAAEANNECVETSSPALDLASEADELEDEQHSKRFHAMNKEELLQEMKNIVEQKRINAHKEASSLKQAFFNSVSQPIYAFNKSLTISRDEFIKYEGVQILIQNYKNNLWIDSDNMTDEEKKNHPEYKTTGGYLKELDYKTAFHEMWNKLNDEKKQEVYKIPNFDPAVFKEITGIDIEEGESK